MSSMGKTSRKQELHVIPIQLESQIPNGETSLEDKELTVLHNTNTHAL